MNGFATYLEAREPSKNIFRFYSIEVSRDLFGMWLVDVRYGRIGSNGTVKRHSCNDLQTVQSIVAAKLEKRNSAKNVSAFAIDKQHKLRCSSYASMKIWYDISGN